ncbi:alpha/beta fold hydrolase [Carboxylicivirga sp. RSCT41]|uniref:alpha/beta fold hydrolase n=1 Tax=Carboxylicivirga agarovorans TaxID=3417570 RepID=UPI003D345A61
MVKLTRRKAIITGIGAVTASMIPSIQGYARNESTSNVKHQPIVLVHGAWHGAWAWVKLIPLLQGAGYSVTTLDLSGLGANSHRQSPEIGLHIHGLDVLNHLFFNDIRDAVVVAHSYGGAVLSQAVAGDKEERISHAIYLDAFLPGEGESVAGFQDQETQNHFKAAAEAGKMVPPRAPETWEKVWGLKGEDALWSAPRMRPMSARCFTEVVQGDPFKSDIRRTYMRCIQNKNPLFDSFSDKTKKDNRFTQTDVDGHHNVMVIDPVEMRDALLAVL